MVTGGTLGGWLRRDLHSVGSESSLLATFNHGIISELYVAS